MKVVAFAVLTTALVVSIASGSLLGVGGNVAQVGVDSLSCEPDGVGLSYTVDGSGNVTKATVSGISTACFGKVLHFDTDASEGGPLVWVPIAAASHTFTFPTPVPMSAVHTATVTIVGGD